MKSIIRTFAVAALSIATLTACDPADDLSAQITRFEQCSLCSKETDFWILVVVTNKGEGYYDHTKWRCAYCNDKDELVGEDSFWVPTVFPNSETPLKTLSSTFAPFHSSQCRLILAR